MPSFEQSYKRLNKQQLQAVDTIDGPLLVIAGPGTGKTELLALRVANILKRTDTNASNILCLTFTESGAQNMRERLRSFIGDGAYDVAISTYHSFGSDIIKNYSEYFQQISVDRSDDIRLERPVDELSQIQIVGQIVHKLPFDSPLLSARYYIKSVVDAISDLKQHLITPEKLRDIANANLSEIEAAQPIIDKLVNDVGGISAKKIQKLSQYQQLLAGLEKQDGNLTKQSAAALQLAHEHADQLNSPTPLNAWKNQWLHKDGNDNFTLSEPLGNQKMLELANIYQAYQQQLQQRAAYDFDDMILRAIDGIDSNDELRFNLQERYQYILLDEFQDTNPSQFELVKQIANHPVHEGKPNIMAVGDDDQAIFAFQGANVGNMKDFLQAFREVKVINLTHNYRSHQDILHLVGKVADQIQDRLHTQLPDINKVLVASSSAIPKEVQLGRHAFSAEAAEYAWVSQKIAQLIDSGVDASKIAVLSPKHKLLENLVPFLKQHNIPLTYEKRENILETEIVSGLRIAAQLLDALATKNTPLINYYFPLVLSLPYWRLAAKDIWKINWQFALADEKRSWAQLALQSPALEPAVSFYLALSATASNEPLEFTLDKLVGSTPVTDGDAEIISPLKAHYFDIKRSSTDALKYYEAVSHLSVIRSRLRDYQATTDKQLGVNDFLEFFAMYEAAETALINAHPVAQSSQAVQLMTVYKAKGLEFDVVFILQAHDDVWGSASRGNNNKLSLPPNLAHIRYAGSSNDERIRLFFVALTRARHNLYITSHTTKDSGKATTPLKYLAEADGVSPYLPEKAQAIVQETTKPQQLSQDIETLWQAGHVSLPADFRSLLAHRLKTYQLSPTHINTFIDTEHGGPEKFFVQTLLRFPQAPTASGEFGTAVHNTLEWYQHQLNAGSKPNSKALLVQYDRQIDSRYMGEQDRTHAKSKGRVALQKYIAARGDMFARPAKAEVNFFSEGVTVGEAHLSGKIDRLEIDKQARTVRIVDYKTGAPFTSWTGSIKSLKYQQQLYFYKMLIEGSNSWRGYKVTEARVEFVEPSSPKDNAIQPALPIKFDDKTEHEMKQLIQAVWQKVMDLDFPDTSKYPPSLKSVNQFIKDLLAK